MKIAFVRGSQLNPWELQTYRHLPRNTSLHLVSGAWSFFEEPALEPGWSRTRLSAWGESGARLGVRWAERQNRLRSWILGESYGLEGLEAAVAADDVLHAAELHSTQSYQCLEIQEKTGKPLVLTIWENLSGAGDRHPRRRARKQAVIAKARAFLAVTDTSKRMLLAEGVAPEKIHVIPMGIELERFQPGPQKDASLIQSLGLHAGRPVLLFIGRLVEEKGLRTLLSAFLTLRPLPQLVILGDGPLAPLVDQARSRFPEHVFWTRSAPYEDIPRWHSLADVFVLPSEPYRTWQEQFGYVLLESMAAGRAIVTTTCGSIPDVVGPAAVLVKPAQPQSLSDALARLLANPAERMSLAARARQRAEQEFAAERVAQKLESAYEFALKSHP